MMIYLRLLYFGLELVTTQSTCRFPDICFLILLYNKPTELKSTTEESFIKQFVYIVSLKKYIFPHPAPGTFQSKREREGNNS